ncbi:MAG: hypothetical protein ACYS7M_16035, partial [Planctomycetota bacterium]
MIEILVGRLRTPLRSGLLAVAACSMAACTPPAATRPPVSDERPHEAPDFEAILPKSVAGQELAVWSVRGRSYIGQYWKLTDQQVEALSRELAEQGQVLDDVMQAVAGRVTPESGPPYLIIATRVGKTAAAKFPRSMGFSNPGAGK